MSDTHTIWDLKRGPWTDEPMFYPPGAHPAMLRMQAALAKLEAAGLGEHDAAGWIRDKIAEFEGCESEVKARYAAMLTRKRKEDA